MKRLNRMILVALTAASVLQTPKPADAGPRRRALRTTVIVAAATGTATAVAAAPRRRTTVVAAAAVVPVRTRPVVVAGAPDLTVTAVAAEGDALCVTVTNIGTAASPTSRLQIDLIQPGAGFVAGQTLRVVPLAVNQSVRIRVRSAPILGLEAQVRVDPRQELAELNERNNDLAASFAEALAAEPAALDAEVVWGALAE